MIERDGRSALPPIPLCFVKLLQQQLERIGRKRFGTDRGLTQEQVAHKAGISTAYLSDIERRLRNPSLANIAKLAKVFGVSLRDLFDGVR